MAAFVLGRRTRGDVEVTRIVVPPFRFTGATLSFVPADLGALAPASSSSAPITRTPTTTGTRACSSRVDLAFMRAGHVDFHGRVGWLDNESRDLDWLFDIVEPRNGDWNVFAHDRDILDQLSCAL